jgi:hypothetical protein
MAWPEKSAMAIGTGGAIANPMLELQEEEVTMAAATYHKGKWKAEVDFEELASGKFQGVVLLFHEEGPSYEQQIMHRAVDVSDTADAALEEGKALAHHLLGNL